jgi:hydrogenase expression/formation protein HypC
MCLAVPGKVIKIDGRKATVQYPDGLRFALIGDEKVKLGDHVLVQMGIIIQVLSVKEAYESSKSWKNVK